MTAKKTDADQVRYTAAETGFYDGHRVREGKTFYAPADFKANWALNDEELAKRKGSVHSDPIRALLDGDAKDVIASIGGSALSTKDDFKRAYDAEASGQKRKAVLNKLNDALENAKTAEADAAADGKDLPKTHAKVPVKGDDKDDDLLS